MPTVPENVNLVSSWEEVDAAAQAIANGVQKSQMAQSVQASLGKADTALQGATGLAQLGEGRAVCNTAAATADKVATVQGSGTFALREGSLLVCYFANAVPAGATLNVNSSGAKDIYYNNSSLPDGMIAGATYALLQYNGTSDKWVLIATSTGPIWAGLQAARTAAMTSPVGIDSNGKLWADTLMTDAARDALLELLANVAYINDRGPELYDNLEAALAAKLDSITAVFTQGSAVVHDTDSLDSLRSMLVVTAVYDNGMTATVTSYTLSGTLSAGTSTVTVSFGGKTTTFDVTVTSGTLYSLENQSVNNERIVPGVAPFTTEDKDLTVGIDITYTSLPSSGTGCKPILINLATDSSTLAVGFALETSNNKAYWMGQSINAGSRSSERTRVILTHAKDSGSMSVYLRQGTGSKQTYTVSGTFATTSKQFSFGQGTSGNYVLPAGTINKAAIYDYVLSDYAIDQFLGLGGT